jgi:hypothetical protein
MTRTYIVFLLLIAVSLPLAAEAALSASVSYPPFPDGSLQTALKPGDEFHLQVNAGIGANLTADLHELGLPHSVPLTGSLGNFWTEPLTLPPGAAEGLSSFSLQGQDAFGNAITGTGTVVVDSVPPTGSVEAAFSGPTSADAEWHMQVAGSYSGTGSEGIITNGYIRGMDAYSAPLGSSSVNVSSIAASPSPFRASLHLPKPDPAWELLTLVLQITDEAGNTASISSPPFPVWYPDQILINHATGGSVIEASNYTAGGIPEGIGIPHSLINSLPEGDYFAVVFFEGLHGCPSNNYSINSFVPDAYWGYDRRGPQGVWSKAVSSKSGGCMQEFHIDPRRADPWMWGALSNTGTSSAIADTQSSIPAFAICTTRWACDTIVPLGQAEAPALSNVLFLPGIKGSSLYKELALCAISSALCDEPLWPPVADLTAPSLFLDMAGKSIERVYAKEHGVLWHAYGLSFYDAFADRMNEIMASVPSWRWEAAAYDWRLSLPDLLHNGRQQDDRIYFEDASSTPYLLQELRGLASTSATGQVTIVAHSNGGLVAKELLAELGDQEAASLVDSLILVGAPQSGAPRALAALLFGAAESLPGTGPLPELLMSAAHARAFGLHSPMAYHLLPSAAYLADVFDPLHPLISFGSGSLLAPVRKLFGSTIASYPALLSYLRGDDERKNPSERDLRNPAVASDSLLSYASDEHARIDSWEAPPGISVYQIAGWGRDTISGVRMYQQEVATWHGKSTRLAYQPQFVEDGDGTVPVPSALMMSESDRVHRYWVDLPEASGTQPYDHGTLFEAPEVEDLIASVLEGAPHLPAHVTTQQPQSLHPLKKLLFVLHDPGQLTVQGGGGKSISITTDGRVLGDLPHAQADALGEDEYVLVPEEDRYAIKISSPTSDSLTFDIEEMLEDTVIASSTFSTPVTQDTSLSFEVRSGIEDMSAVTIDVDGDGTQDLSLPIQLGKTVLAPAIEIEEHRSSGRGGRHAAVPVPPEPSDFSSQKMVMEEIPVPVAHPAAKKPVQHTVKPEQEESPSQSERPAEKRSVLEWIEGRLAPLISLLHRLFDFVF